MKNRRTVFLLFLFLVLLSFSRSYSQNNAAENWPQWRGSMNTGSAMNSNPPVVFGENQNLKWKIAIPGKGHATPLVWNDKIIVQTAVATNEVAPEATANTGEGNRMAPSQTDKIHEFRVLLINRSDGSIIWDKTVAREWPQENTHELGSWASNSPCTDGEKIYAYFGSRGVHCLDFKGNVLWQRDFGQMQKNMSFGEGSSPYLYKDKLFIQWDHEGDSYLFALNKNTGETDWQMARDEGTSWATPLVVEVSGKTQVITSATKQVRAYDYNTGEVIWTSTGLTRNVIPSPLYRDGILYVLSGFRGSALQAIDISKAKGDITGTEAILWTYNQETPYTPQALLMDDKLYFLRVNNGFLSCLDAKTGNPYYTKQNLEAISTLYSSPTGAGNHIYIAAKGVVMVLKAGENYEVVATNKLDDNFHASPVAAGNDLILRGFNSLYCFSEK